MLRNTSPPVVTIGLPIFNCEYSLPAAVRSIFSQTHADWELIIVDDGSSDNSLQIALAIQDPRVAVIADGVNRGLVCRLNQITEMAQGQYLARMDGDDMMHPERLERQLQLLESQPDVDVVGAAAYVIDSANIPYGKRGIGRSNATPAAVVAHGLFLHPTVMGRRQWFEENRYDAQYIRAEDHELWCRTLNQTRFASTDEPLLFYREPDRFRLRNYVLSCRTDRRIIRMYGPVAIGKCATNRLIAKSFVKEATYRVAHALGRSTVLVRRRSVPLFAAERKTATATLAQIAKTQVPGLDIAPPVTVERISR